MSSRVLVLDDSPVLVELTTQSLQAAGVGASGALDLAELDRQLGANDFDLILVDVKMPEVFGDDVLDFLRSQRSIRSKLVLYSDLPEAELADKARDCAADGYICKAKGLENAVADVLRFLADDDPAAQSRQADVKPGIRSRQESAPQAASKKRRVLVVDGSEPAAQWVEPELSSKGFAVTTVGSTDEAMKVILKKRTRPDLVLLEVKTPAAKREQLCRFIKDNRLFAGIQVLLCSGGSVEELKRVCRESGADGYLSRGAALGQLLARGID